MLQLSADALASDDVQDRPTFGHRLIAGMPWAELAIVAGLALAAVLIGVSNGLPFTLPESRALGMMGFHYLLPVATMAIWGAVIFLTRRDGVIGYYAVAFACYLCLLVIHFNLKLWIPQVNPASWDGVYWALDEAMRPLVDLCFAIRGALAATFGDIDSLYLLGFVMMFYASFITHALQDKLVFRRLVVASFLVHALGALMYMIAPAVGPFIYEAGANAHASVIQMGMLEAHNLVRTEGAPWLAENGGRALTAGLAAMPSLHTAASAVFLWFAWRYLKPLTILYLPAFLFILVEAVASRWHYVVDLPVGAALAAFAIWAAHRIYPAPVRKRQIRKSPEPTPYERLSPRLVTPVES